jgi:hypothetical protein
MLHERGALSISHILDNFSNALINNDKNFWHASCL